MIFSSTDFNCLGVFFSLLLRCESCYKMSTKHFSRLYLNCINSPNKILNKKLYFAHAHKNSYTFRIDVNRCASARMACARTVNKSFMHAHHCLFVIQFILLFFFSFILCLPTITSFSVIIIAMIACSHIHTPFMICHAICQTVHLRKRYKYRSLLFAKSKIVFMRRTQFYGIQIECRATATAAVASIHATRYTSASWYE